MGQHSLGSTGYTEPTTVIAPVLSDAALPAVELAARLTVERAASADHAATDRANYRVVPRIVTGHSADDRALETACGVCLACRREGRRRCNQGASYQASFHSKILCRRIFRI